MAGAFCFVCSYIPLHLADFNYKVSIPFSLVQSIFVFGLTLPFDVRDIQVDSIDGNMTLATYLGRRRALLLSVITLLIAAICSGLFWEWDIALPIIITALITNISIHILSRKHQVNDFYYTFWLDGMLILPFWIYEISRVINS